MEALLYAHRFWLA